MEAKNAEAAVAAETRDAEAAVAAAKAGTQRMPEADILFDNGTLDENSADDDGYEDPLSLITLSHILCFSVSLLLAFLVLSCILSLPLCKRNKIA